MLSFQTFYGVVNQICCWQKMLIFQLWNVTRRHCSSTITFPRTRCKNNQLFIIEIIKTMKNVCRRSATQLKNTKSFWLWWRNVFGWCVRWSSVIARRRRTIREILNVNRRNTECSKISHVETAPVRSIIATIRMNTTKMVTMVGEIMVSASSMNTFFSNKHKSQDYRENIFPFPRLQISSSGLQTSSRMVKLRPDQEEKWKDDQKPET